jgi:outer membrane biosynthesis protein TonB
MVWKLLLISLLAAPIWAVADSPDDYFHTGVQDYIFGQKEKAKTAIGTGLQLYPTDPKLNGAWQLLQKKEREKQQQQNQQNKDQQDQQQQQQQTGQGQGQKSEEQKQQEEKAKQEQAKKEQEKREQQAEADKGEQKDKKDEEGQQASATELHMSPQEARKLLDSLKDDDKVLLFPPTNRPADLQRGKFKDW